MERITKIENDTRKSREIRVPKNLFMRVQEEMERRSNLTSGTAERNGYTAACTQCPASFSAVTAVRSSAGSDGTEEDADPRYGGALAEC